MHLRRIGYPLNKPLDIIVRFLHRFILVQINLLAFQCLEEALDNCVVMRISPAAVAVLNPVVLRALRPTLPLQTIKYPDGIIKRIRYSRLPPNIEADILPVRNGVA